MAAGLLVKVNIINQLIIKNDLTHEDPKLSFPVHLLAAGIRL